LRRVNRVGLRDLRRPGRLLVPARAQPFGDPVERVARRDLCLPPPIDESPGAGIFDRARRRPLSAQPIEASLVDALERQRALEACLACRVDLRGSLDGALAIELRAVTLETQWFRRRGGPAAL